jgi:anti-sigma regulatory factor (Ser/Thr protein kinase)
MTTTIPGVDGGAFRHEAFLYAGDAEFLRGASSFVHDANEAGEPVLVAVSAAKIDALRDVLGADADNVLFADMREVGANPAWILPAWRAFLDTHSAGGTSVRGIGEPIWDGRTRDELVECQRHEELLNVAFAGGRPWWLLCPYDTTTLDDDVVAEARRSHPYIWCGGTHGRSADARDLAAMRAPFAAPLPEPPDGADQLAFTGAESLARVRAFVEAHAASADLEVERTEALVLAVHEVGSNSVRHGGGSGTLTIWASDRAVVCEVRDHGQLDDPLVGRELPPRDRAEGRGVWIANRLCDLVQVRVTPEGTVVRLHAYRDAT